jgi:hypothetical protein
VRWHGKSKRAVSEGGKEEREHAPQAQDHEDGEAASEPAHEPQDSAAPRERGSGAHWPEPVVEWWGFPEHPAASGERNG